MIVTARAAYTGAVGCSSVKRTPSRVFFGNPDYEIKTGLQMSVLCAMIQRVTGR